MKPWSLLMGELDTAIQVAIAAARSDEFDVRQEAEGTLRRAVQSVAAHQPVNTTEYEERLLISGQLMNLCHGADMDWLEPMALALSERPGDDLFSASAAGSLEGGEIELVAVGAPPADWPPARRFWNSFLIADPGDLSPLGGVTSTPRSLSRWASDVNLVFASTPESAGDFGGGPGRRRRGCRGEFGGRVAVFDAVILVDEVDRVAVVGALHQRALADFDAAIVVQVLGKVPPAVGLVTHPHQ